MTVSDGRVREIVYEEIRKSIYKPLTLGVAIGSAGATILSFNHSYLLSLAFGLLAVYSIYRFVRCRMVT